MPGTRKIIHLLQVWYAHKYSMISVRLDPLSTHPTYRVASWCQMPQDIPDIQSRQTRGFNVVADPCIFGKPQIPSVVLDKDKQVNSISFRLTIFV